MPNYKHFGPFEVPRIGQRVDREQLNEQLWAVADEEAQGLSTAMGCYIFGMRAGGAITPWYVGKASGKRGFKQEVFEMHKLVHYNDVLAKYKRGTPVVMLTARITPTEKFSSGLSDKEAEWVEGFLLSLALEANDELMNKRGIKLLRDCVIPGLLNGSKRGYDSPTLEHFHIS